MTHSLVPHAPVMAMGTLEDPERLGKVLAASGYFSDARDAAQAVVKVLAGAELGFGPIASMTGVYIVKGRVTLSANLLAAAIKRHPRYDFRVRDLTDERCAVAFFDAGQEAGTSEFTMDDARKAGLAGGENWRKYPRNMLFARCVSNGAKFFCPDVFAGAPVYTPDELGADIDGETGEVIGVAINASTGEVTERHAPAPEPVQISGDAAPEPVSDREPDTEPERPGGTTTTAVPTAAVPSAPPEADANDPATPEEVAKLREVLEALGVPDTFMQMALMTMDKNDAGELTRGEVASVLERAKTRFGG
jgi:hypothetical protein